jgi:hypothetical protein
MTSIFENEDIKQDQILFLLSVQKNWGKKLEHISLPIDSVLAAFFRHFLNVKDQRDKQGGKNTRQVKVTKDQVSELLGRLNGVSS